MAKIYLSGAITDLTYDEARYGWRQEIASLFDKNIIALSPMRHEGHLAELKGPITDKALIPHSHLLSHPKMIVAKDFLDIDECTIVVINFQGKKKPGRSSFIELGYAKAKGKTIIMIANDDDPICSHPFTSTISDVIVSSVKDAAIVVNSLLSEGI